MRLRAVFNDCQLVFLRDGQELGHRCGVTIEMNRQECLDGMRSAKGVQRLFNTIGSHGECLSVDVDEDGRVACPTDRSYGGNGSVRHSDNRVTWLKS